MNIIDIQVKTPDPNIRIDDFRESLEKALELTLKYSERKSVSDINNGYCAVFTDYVEFVFTRKELLEICHTSNPINHYFVKYDGKFYDAECLDGVKNYKDLPIFKEVRSRKFSLVKWLESLT